MTFDALKDMRIVSWNVNGLRALGKERLVKFFNDNPAHVYCIQETKVDQGAVPRELVSIEGYESYWDFHTSKGGYSGTCIYVKDTCGHPLDAWTGFDRDDPTYHGEGRVVSLDFGAFILVNCYFPNGGQGDERVEYKLGFCRALTKWCQEQRRGDRGIIVIGDVNTCHTEIDISNPTANSKRSGFLPVERRWFDEFLELGFVDSFRHYHPGEEGHFTWWSVRTGARERNVGWRLDYALVSQAFFDKHVEKGEILNQVMGSDHCPIALSLRDIELKENEEAPPLCGSEMKCFDDPDKRQTSILSFFGAPAAKRAKKA